MTPELAARVRHLRVEQGESWRSVSDDVFSYPEASVLSDWAAMRGDQPLGMYLCEAAAQVLGEDSNKEPWN
jgi:hypothetical protein